MAALLDRLNEGALRRMGKGLPLRVPPIPRAADPADYLTVATVVLNEAYYLREWIEFHRMMGVGRFVIYDNGSTDGTAELLAPYRAQGWLDLVPWRRFDVWGNAQLLAYGHALANWGPSCRWLGFFDVDEFMFPTHEHDLLAVLKPREDLPVLAAPGLFFGASGHTQRPPGLVVDHYLRSVQGEARRRHDKMLNTKCFVQPSAVEGPASAHYFVIRGDRAIGYTADGTPLYGHPRADPDKLGVETIRYNHYYTRSAEEFLAKKQRGTVRGPQFRVAAARKQKMFDSIEALASEDRTILRLRDRFVAHLRSAGLAPWGEESISPWIG